MLSPERLADEATSALAEARRRRDELVALAPETSPSDVIERFDRLGLPLDGLRGWARLLAMAHPEESVRERAEAVVRDVAAFGTELSLDTELFGRLASLEDVALDDAQQRRLVEHALRDYRRAGVDRDEATRARIASLRDELVELGQTFDRNIVNGGRTVRFERGHQDLAGCPEDFLRAHPEDADGSVTLTTDPSVRLPFLTYCTIEANRRRYLEAALNRAHPENQGVLRALIAKRHELATLLGYASWADYVTEENMSKSAANVRGFLEGLVEKLAARLPAELAELLELKREFDPEASRVEEWDRFFLMELGKAHHCGVDSREARRYFPVDAVLRGCLETVERVFAVELVRDDQAELWHESALAWDVLRDGERIARFYLDLHPRDGKFKHACLSSIARGVADEQVPEGCLLCNFPEATDADPGFLFHEQVTTLFHEFGHLMHHLLAGGHRYLSFAGISTEWDFVEVPSQLFEEWAWEPEVLQRFAKHPESGEPIPRDLIERMRRADEYGKAIDVSVQLTYGLLSLSLYDRDPEGVDPMDVMLRQKRETFPYPHVEGTAFVASFGHLHGYSAMYYTYLWSLSIAKDLFERFEGRLLDPELGKQYVDEVLVPGGSKDAVELVQAFLGREPNSAAFERWLAS